MSDRPVHEYAETGGEANGDPLNKDFRQVIGDLLRVVVFRRWFFFIPCCLGLTGAFLVSHHIPRRYIARTLFERRDDPVIASVIHSSLQPSLDTIRRSMALDLKSHEAIVQAVLDLSWTEGLPRDANGNLTPAGNRQVAALVTDIKKNIRIRMLQNSSEQTVTELTYAGTDPVITAEVVNRMRDNYLKRSQDGLRRLMRESGSFFEAKVKEERAKLVSVRMEMERLGEGVPEKVNVRRPETLEMLVSSLRNQQEELRRKHEELSAEIAARENFLRASKGVRPAGSEGQEIDVELAVLGDPEVSRLRKDLREITNRIRDLETSRRMKEPHPVMQQYVRERARLEAAVAQAKEESAARLRGGGTSDVGQTGLEEATLSPDARRVMMELDSLRKLLRLNEASAERMAAKLASVESTKPRVKERYQEYLALEKEERDLKESLALWEESHTSITRWFEVDESEKGHIFRTIEPALPTKKPYSPRTATVFVFCLLLGGLAGVAGVLLAELFDPTLRTASQVSRSLGIPIIEGVSEIITPAASRQRFLRRVVYQPALAVVMLLMVSAAGTTAYLSIEKPSQFAQLRQFPGQAWSSLIGRSETGG